MNPAKLAVLGCGNMGSAIVLGLSKKRTDFSFYTYTPTRTRAESLAKQVGGTAVGQVSELAPCEYFLIACKPQQFGALAPELKKVLSKGSKIISIMAGVSTKRLQESLGCPKVARAMPNTPALISEGVTAIYCVGMDSSESARVQQIFESVSRVFLVDSDDAIDVVTIGIASGSGYIFEIARIFSNKMHALGIPKDEAAAMVKQMIKGSGALMVQSVEDPEILRNKVTSKGGTTEAALKILQSRNLEGILSEALEAAYHRAKELG